MLNLKNHLEMYEYIIFVHALSELEYKQINLLNYSLNIW